MLRRRLSGSEVVHHVNGNRSDNRPENLVVYSEPGDHLREHKRKLLPSEVRAIRSAYANCLELQRSIAERFGISKASVSEIIRGEKYATDGGPIRRRQRKLSPKSVLYIRTSVSMGTETKANLARELGVTPRVISRVANGEIYRDVE